jgi:hypothetical protein
MNLETLKTYQGRRGKVAPESGADNSTATVRADHLAPNAPELRSILLGLGLVHVGQPLSKVPVHFLTCIHTFNLKERGAGVLVRLGPAQPRIHSSEQCARALVHEPILIIPTLTKKSLLHNTDRDHTTPTAKL